MNLNTVDDSGGGDEDSYIASIKNVIKSTKLIMIIMRGLPGNLSLSPLLSSIFNSIINLNRFW